MCSSCQSRSFYHWKGKTQEDAETLLSIKTARTLFEPAIARIKDVHRYEVPEIVGTDIVAGFSGYLDWIDQVTG